jgi:hypothetical protein
MATGKMYFAGRGACALALLSHTEGLRIWTMCVTWLMGHEPRRWG